MEGDLVLFPVPLCPRIFQSTPSVWRETTDKIPLLYVIDISIHSLRMEGDKTPAFIVFKEEISIHSLRMEGDIVICNCSERLHSISIHSLRMEGDFCRICVNIRIMHFNPLPPYGGRLPVLHLAHLSVIISIHSLRMEGDKN